MEAMRNLEDKGNRMSLRGSFLVWVFSAVAGWAVAVVAVYTLIREDGDPVIARSESKSDVSEKAHELNEIEPAAGMTKPEGD